MLNKKEYIMLELIKLYKGEKSYSELDRLSEKIIQSGEEYQLELEEAERLRDDDNDTLDLRDDEL